MAGRRLPADRLDRARFADRAGDARLRGQPLPGRHRDGPADGPDPRLRRRQSAPTVEERAELAVRELGAARRLRAVAHRGHRATLRGYVNPIIPDAVEHFSGGDCACVVDPVLRQAHDADAGQGADRRAHPPRAAAAAGAPPRRRRGHGLRRVARRVGEPERVPDAAGRRRSTRSASRARCGSGRRTSRSCGATSSAASCPIDERVAMVRATRPGGGGSAGRRARCGSCSCTG